MRTALVTASVLGLILLAGISTRWDQASAQSRDRAAFQGYWMGVDPVDGGDARRRLIRHENERARNAVDGGAVPDLTLRHQHEIRLGL